MKVVENFVKKVMMKNSLIEKRYVVGTHWNLPHRGNSVVHLQHMLLKTRKKTIWKFTFSKYHFHFFYVPVICNHVPLGPGNSGDIDFSICKALVKSLHCRDFVSVKSLLKVPTPWELLPDSWAFIMNPCNI